MYDNCNWIDLLLLCFNIFNSAEKLQPKLGTSYIFSTYIIKSTLKHKTTTLKIRTHWILVQHVDMIRSLIATSRFNNCTNQQTSWIRPFFGCLVTWRLLPSASWEVNLPSDVANRWECVRCTCCGLYKTQWNSSAVSHVTRRFITIDLIWLIYYILTY